MLILGILSRFGQFEDDNSHLEQRYIMLYI